MKPILLDALEELFPNKDWVVHHKDGDKLNNNIFNLEVIEDSKHRNLHSIGENNNFYGKTHTKESKKKISDAHKGKPLSKEHKEAVRIGVTKQYKRIVKNGFIKGVQRYSIKDGAKIIFSSTDKNKLEEMLCNYQ